jgi:hypothetical protein
MLAAAILLGVSLFASNSYAAEGAAAGAPPQTESTETAPGVGVPTSLEEEQSTLEQLRKLEKKEGAFTPAAASTAGTASSLKKRKPWYLHAGLGYIIIGNLNVKLVSIIGQQQTCCKMNCILDTEPTRKSGAQKKISNQMVAREIKRKLSEYPWLSFFGTPGVHGNHHKVLVRIALTRKMVFMVSEVSERSDNIPGVSFYMWW